MIDLMRNVGHGGTYNYGPWMLNGAPESQMLITSTAVQKVFAGAPGTRDIPGDAELRIHTWRSQQCQSLCFKTRHQLLLGTAPMR